MIIVLLEKSDNLINPFMDKLFQKIPRSCRAVINKKTAHDKIRSYKQPPLLAAGWLLIVSTEITNTQINLVNTMSEQNYIVFNCNTKKSFNELQERFIDLGVKYSIVDNYVVSKDQIVKFIINNLQVSEEDAKYLARRQNYYIRSVVSSVNILKTLPKVDRDAIKKYTSKQDSIPIYEIFNYIFKLDECKLDYSAAIKLVYQYRYGFSHILNYLKDTCDLYLYIFELMVEGQLTLQNYKDFRNDTTDKKIKNITEYQLSKIVTHFEVISVEYLFFVRQTVDGIEDDIAGIPDFINFLKAIS